MYSTVVFCFSIKQEIKVRFELIDHFRIFRIKINEILNKISSRIGIIFFKFVEFLRKTQPNAVNDEISELLPLKK